MTPVDSHEKVALGYLTYSNKNIWDTKIKKTQVSSPPDILVYQIQSLANGGWV